MSIMAHIYRIATLNIKGITSQTKMAVLADFVIKQDIDVPLLQEVTTIIPVNLGGYVMDHNIGTSGKDTAILTRAQLELREMFRLPSERGMAADMEWVLLVNVYAPSGVQKRQKREDLFNLEVPYLVRPAKISIILGGTLTASLRKRTVPGITPTAGP
jgi:exonuclease III